MAIEIPIDKIRKQPQVRRMLDEASLKGLAASISEVGQLHPIIVRPEGDGYLLISGERRLEAMRLLGHKTIKAIIWDGKASAREVQLIENIQREDIDPLSRALAVVELLSSEGLNKKEAAARLGIPRTTLTDWLDILDVDEKYQKLVVDNFQGGDSPLSVSHISIALGVASKLGRQRLAEQMLDAAVEHDLSRGQMQELGKILLENPSLSVKQAIKMLFEGRREQRGGAGSETKSPVARLISSMGRWQGQLEKVRELLRGDLPVEERQELISGLHSIKETVDSLVAELEG